MLPSPTKSPVRAEFLVAFVDLTHYTKLAQALDCLSNFTFIAEFADRVGQGVEDSQGVVVKYIGDAALLVWPADKVDAGVRALVQLKETIDGWLADQGLTSRLVIKAHYGEVAWGLLGSSTDLRPDVIGETVNTAALLPSHGLALSPQVFRKLDPGTRSQFKKHTPPVTYIAVKERHRN